MIQLNKSVLAVALSVCTYSSLNAGTISGGGGGGTIPTHPVGRYAVEEILRYAPAELEMFFAYQRDRNGRWEDPRLYQEGKNIFDVIKNTKIGINTTGPCLDANANEVDGSIYGPVETSICMSTKTIGSKLDKHNVYPQTIALLAHEYSHLLGFDEKDADKLQHTIALYFDDDYRESWYGKFPSFVFVIDDFSNKTEDLKLIANYISKFDPAEKITYWNESCKKSRQLIEALYKYMDEVSRESIMPVTLEHLNIYHQVFLKNRGLKMATCGMSSVEVRWEEDEYLYIEYLKVFKTEKALKTSEYEKIENEGVTLIYDENPLLMTKIESIEDARKEALDLVGQFEKMISEFNRLRLQSELIEF